MTDFIAVRFLKSSIVLGDFSALRAIPEGDYTADFKKIREYVDSFFLKYSRFPTLKEAESDLKIAFDANTDNLDYIANQYKDRELGRQLVAASKETVKAVENRDAAKALKITTDAVIKVTAETQRQKIVSYRKSAEDRYTEYTTRRVLNGVLSPWDSLNKQINCFANGTMNVIVANSEVGKTWALAILADHFEQQGHKVLFVTAEMAKERVATRLDVLRLKVPFREFRNCSFTSISHADLKTKLSALSTGTGGDIFLAGKDSISSVLDIQILAKELKPDVILVDGAYRLDASTKSAGIWERNYQLVKDLQVAAEKSNKPWIVTTQLWDDDESKNQSTFKKRDTIKYAKEWIIDPDVVIALRQNEDLKTLNRLEIQPLKIRDAVDRKVSVYVNWDVEKLDYTEYTATTSAVSPSAIGNITVSYT